MTDENEVTGFIQFSKIDIKRSSLSGDPNEIIIEGDFRDKQNDLESKGKVFLHYGYKSDDGKVRGTSSAKSIPEYTLRMIQKDMAYLVREVRNRFSDFCMEDGGVFGLCGSFNIVFRIDVMFELRMIPRRIGGASKAPGSEGEGESESDGQSDHNDDRWAIE